MLGRDSSFHTSYCSPGHLSLQCTTCGLSVNISNTSPPSSPALALPPSIYHHSASFSSVDFLFFPCIPSSTSLLLLFPSFYHPLIYPSSSHQSIFHLHIPHLPTIHLLMHPFIHALSIYLPVILPSSIHQSSSHSPIIHLPTIHSPIHLHTILHLSTIYQSIHPSSIHHPPIHPFTHLPSTYHPSIYHSCPSLYPAPPSLSFARGQPLVPTPPKIKGCQLPQQLSLPSCQHFVSRVVPRLLSISKNLCCPDCPPGLTFLLSPSALGQMFWS